jgi:hypothetical protein
MGTSSRDLKKKAVHEMKEFLLITLYLWVVLGLFVLYKSVLMAEEHVSFVYHGLALINALVFAKIVLIGRALHLGERFDDAPLIYPTLLKSASFTGLLICCKVLEDTAVGYLHGKSFQESISDLGGGSWKEILTLTMLLFVVFIPFFGMDELRRVLGGGKLRGLLFYPRPLLDQPRKQS